MPSGMVCATRWRATIKTDPVSTIRSPSRKNFARQIFGVKPGDTLLILGDEETGIIVTKPDVLRDAADDIFGKMEK